MNKIEKLENQGNTWNEATQTIEFNSVNKNAIIDKLNEVIERVNEMKYEKI